MKHSPVHHAEKQRWKYTYFKKPWRREQWMAVVEQRLHDRKELWFPYYDWFIQFD